MSYGPNYYNYQIAVVFAILIVALLILGAFILGIYYVFVVNVRNKKTANTGGGRMRTPNSIPATRSNWQAGAAQSAAATSYSPEFQRPLPPQEYAYDPRLQPGYIQQQPLVAQQPVGGYSERFDYPSKVRELQPEYVYQQGPVTWTTTQQVHETYPVSPVQQIQGATSASAYHMSSV